MQPSDADAPRVAGLIIDDGDGQYFAIAWDELRCFRVAALHLAQVQALVVGAEPAGDVRGAHGEDGDQPTEDANVLLAEVIGPGAPGHGRLAARRGRAWALLR